MDVLGQRQSMIATATSPLKRVVEFQLSYHTSKSLIAYPLEADRWIDIGLSSPRELHHVVMVSQRQGERIHDVRWKEGKKRPVCLLDRVDGD
jgi:hypothetical protein